MILKVLKKELIEQIRDRRTLFLNVLLPLLMIPGLLFLFDQIGPGSEEELQPKILISDGWSEEEKQQFQQQTGFVLETSAQPEQEVEEGNAIAYIVKPQQPGTIDLYLPNGGEYNALLQLQIENFLLSLDQPQTAWNVTPQLIGEDKNPLLDSMNFYFLSLIIGFAPLVGGMGAAIDAIAGEKERGTLRSLYLLPIRPRDLWIGKWLNVSIISVFTAFIAMAALIITQQFMAQPMMNLDWLFSLSMMDMIGLGLLFIFYALFIGALQLIISTFSKSFKEAQSYSSPIIFLSMAPTFILMIEQGPALPLSYFWIPVFNIHSLIWEGVNHGLVATHMWIALGTNLLVVLIAIVIGALLFHRQKQHL